MKAEKDNLHKTNREYKEYFDKQNDRLNALRNVNQNLTKKLQQKQSKKAGLEQEQSLFKAEQQVKELNISLKHSEAEMEVIKSKFRASTSQLKEEQSKNQVLITVNSQLQQKLKKIERQYREAINENLKLKVGDNLQKNKQKNKLQMKMPTQLSSNQSEIQIAPHRRILSTHNRMQTSDGGLNQSEFGTL